MLKACLQSFPVLHIGNSFQQHFSVALAYTVASRNRDDACPFAYTVPFQHSCRNAAFEQCLILFIRCKWQTDVSFGQQEVLSFHLQKYIHIYNASFQIKDN